MLENETGVDQFSNRFGANSIIDRGIDNDKLAASTMFSGLLLPVAATIERPDTRSSTSS